MQEIWKDVPSFDGDYKVSNQGRIMSFVQNSPRMMKLSPDKDGYLCLAMRSKKFKAHRVVLWAFVGQSEMQVDHINGDKKDNRLCNLEYVSPRENIRRMKGRGRILGAVKGKIKGQFRASVRFNGQSYDLGHFKTKEEANEAFLSATEDSCIRKQKERMDNKTSQYVGVTWVESQRKWCAKRTFKGRCYNLGSFDCELDAYNTYREMTELKALDILERRKKSKSSRYEGVSLRRDGKWHARYKDKHIGYFESEKEAFDARCRHLQKL